MVDMKAPHGVTEITLEGFQVKVGKSGVADIPERYVETAKSHGFTLAAREGTVPSGRAALVALFASDARAYAETLVGEDFLIAHAAKAAEDRRAWFAPGEAAAQEPEATDATGNDDGAGPFDDIGDQFSRMGKDELRDWLKENGVGFPGAALRPRLAEIAREVAKAAA